MVCHGGRSILAVMFDLPTAIFTPIHNNGVIAVRFKLSNNNKAYLLLNYCTTIFCRSYRASDLKGVVSDYCSPSFNFGVGGYKMPQLAIQAKLN